MSLGALTALATVALRLRDPHREGSWGKCPSLIFFGLYCPLCGGLRAVNDLTHLDLPSALASNAFAVVVLVGLVFWWALVLRDRVRGLSRPWFSYAPTGWSSWLVVGVFIAFGVARNVVPALSP